MRKSELRKILKNIGLTPQKHLGQNFLASEKIAERIVNAASLKKKDFVVEVGPGLGVVTEKILEKGAIVLAVEIDRRLSSYLNDRFISNKNFHLIEDDFFHIDLKTLSSYNGTHKMKFISNLPYRGAKKIVRKLTEMNTFNTMVITVQKEVANAIIEKPGSADAQSITYSAQYLFKIQKLFDIPFNFFYPSPTVNSTSLLFSLKRLSVKSSNKSFFFYSIDVLMQNKRKKLKNKIKSAFQLSESEINKIFMKYLIEDNSRVTDLTLKQMINLSNDLYEEVAEKKCNE